MFCFLFVWSIFLGLEILLREYVVVIRVHITSIEQKVGLNRFSFLLFINLFIYLFLAALGLHFCARGLSLAVASGGYSSLRCVGFSLWWLLLLWSTGSRHVGTIVMAHGL